MKVLRLVGKLAACLLVCAALAGADSLHLRNGHHFQGKYIGGTTTSIGFITGGSVEYFATSDVLALIFDSANETPLSGLQAAPMKGHISVTGVAQLRRINASTRTRIQHAKLNEKAPERKTDPGQLESELSGRAGPSSR
jgi:hypothetical protein